MNVFMFHFGRCGSTALTKAIGQIPGFFWHGEIFSRNTFIYKGFEEHPFALKKGNGQFVSSEFIDFVKECKEGSSKRFGIPVNHYGCEIKSYHFECKFFHFSLDEAILELSKKFSDARFIFLSRQNSLRRIVSSLIARNTGVYHVSSSPESPTKYEVDLDNFLDADLNCRGSLENVLHNSELKMKSYRQAVLGVGGSELRYEDDVDGALGKTLARLATEWELPIITPKVDISKTNPHSLAEIISNYGALQKELGNTPYAWMLDT